MIPLKDYLKITLMTIIGFMCSLLIYPFLHEWGHALTAILLGGKCVAIHLFPSPYMVCDAADIGEFELVAIGLSGILFPLPVSFVLCGGNFYMWFARLILRGIIVLSLAISALIVALRNFGIVAQGDDITEILHIWSGGSTWIGGGSLVLCVLVSALIVKDKPVRKITVQLGQAF